MSRSFGSRLLQEVKQVFEPEDALHDSEPENEYVTGAAPHPTEGDPAHGIPVYPDPLPGGHEYQAKEVVTRQRVDVPPNKPYYSQGMAHGVKAPEHHNGRIAPKPHERHNLRGETEAEPQLGSYKLEPIPVYVTEPGEGVHPLNQASFRQITIVPGADPVPIVERNPSRTRLLILNETPPNTQEINPATPAAGTGFVYTNNTNSPQGVLTVRATLTTDATVLNRFIMVTVKDAAGNILWSAVNGNATTASSTIAYNGYVGATQQNSATGTFTFPLPGNDGAIPPGGTLSITSGAFGAGDQISGIAIVFAASGGGVRLKSGPISANGALLPGGTQSYRDIKTQDQVWAVADTNATVNQILSVIEEYKIAR